MPSARQKSASVIRHLLNATVIDEILDQLRVAVNSDREKHNGGPPDITLTPKARKEIQAFVKRFTLSDPMRHGKPVLSASNAPERAMECFFKWLFMQWYDAVNREFCRPEPPLSIRVAFLDLWYSISKRTADIVAKAISDGRFPDEGNDWCIKPLGQYSDSPFANADLILDAANIDERVKIALHGVRKRMEPSVRSLVSEIPFALDQCDSCTRNMLLKTFREALKLASDQYMGQNCPLLTVANWERFCFVFTFLGLPKLLPLLGQCLSYFVDSLHLICICGPHQFTPPSLDPGPSLPCFKRGCRVKFGAIRANRSCCHGLGRLAGLVTRVSNLRQLEYLFSRLAEIPCQIELRIAFLGHMEHTLPLRDQNGDELVSGNDICSNVICQSLRRRPANVVLRCITEGGCPPTVGTSVAKYIYTNVPETQSVRFWEEPPKAECAKYLEEEWYVRVQQGEVEEDFLHDVLLKVAHKFPGEAAAVCFQSRRDHQTTHRAWSLHYIGFFIFTFTVLVAWVWQMRVSRQSLLSLELDSSAKPFCDGPFIRLDIKNVELAKQKLEAGSTSNSRVCLAMLHDSEGNFAAARSLAIDVCTEYEQDPLANFVACGLVNFFNGRMVDCIRFRKDAAALACKQHGERSPICCRALLAVARGSSLVSWDSDGHRQLAYINKTCGFDDVRFWSVAELADNMRLAGHMGDAEAMLRDVIPLAKRFSSMPLLRSRACSAFQDYAETLSMRGQNSAAKEWYVASRSIADGSDYDVSMLFFEESKMMLYHNISLDEAIALTAHGSHLLGKVSSDERSIFWYFHYRNIAMIANRSGAPVNSTVFRELSDMITNYPVLASTYETRILTEMIGGRHFR